MQSEFDFIVVGGGSSGCILASRLSEDPDVSVLLLEQGPGYRGLILGVPLLGMRFARRHMQVHWTEPQKSCNQRRIELPVGKGMGGGSAVNAMIYTRGERRSYERWAEQGATGWDYAGVLPYFRKMEDFEGGENAFHGIGGPVGISETRYTSGVGLAFIDACVEMGLPLNPDLTGERQHGAGFYQFTQANGLRSSTASGQFRSAVARKNLHVSTHTAVDRILFDGARATGVQCRRSARPLTFRATREVIVSAGAIGSPKLLMLSGIGPADELAALGIEPRLDLPQVGRGLQDHPRCPIVYLPREPVSLDLPSLVLPAVQWCIRRTGVFASTTVAAGAFARLSEESAVADTQYVVKWGMRGPAFRGCIDFESCLIDVESRGEVRLRSSNPLDSPAVNPNYLSYQREIDVLVSAIRFARALAGASALKRFGLVRELRPGSDLTTKRELEQYVRNQIETCFHVAGTCRMGFDGNSVVDPHLRVRGIECLRVVDASVMPILINGNTNGPTIMIAERAADLISRGSADLDGGSR